MPKTLLKLIVPCLSLIAKSSKYPLLIKFCSIKLFFKEHVISFSSGFS